LLLFTAIYLFCLQLYLKNDTIINALYLACSMAALMYSKYHGVLVLFFTLAPHWHLLTRWRFYMSGILALLFWLPHMHWQYTHEFPTFYYHLVERSTKIFKWEHIGHYIAHQCLLFNPALLPVLLYYISPLRYWKQGKAFDKSLLLLLYGFWLFFLWNSTKAYVEPHWTVVASIPLIILGYRAMLTQTVPRRYLFKVAVASTGIILLLRVAIAYQYVPKRAHELKQDVRWAKAISARADTLPVVFSNAYDAAAKYQFHTQHASTSLNNVYWRRNQYDIWNFEELFNGKDVLLVSSHCSKQYKALTLPDSTVLYTKYLRNLQWYPKLRFTGVAFPSSAKVGDTLTVNFTLHNPYEVAIDLKQQKMRAALRQRRRIVAEFAVLYKAESLHVAAGDSVAIQAQIPLPFNKTGIFELSMGCSNNYLPPPLHTNWQKIHIHTKE